MSGNFTVFNMRLAGYLMLKGFRLVAISPDNKNPKMNTFHFPNSEELHKAIDKYLQTR